LKNLSIPYYQANYRYEKAEFQSRVRLNYDALYDSSYWRTVDTDGLALDDVFQRALAVIRARIDDSADQHIDTLWWP